MLQKTPRQHRMRNAEYVKLCRARRRRGVKCFTLPMHEQKTIMTLRHLGLLHKHNPSRTEVEAALTTLFTRITLRWAEYSRYMGFSEPLKRK
jgi:hypothetical protein